MLLESDKTLENNIVHSLDDLISPYIILFESRF
jgi:hypothetical protein